VNKFFSLLGFAFCGFLWQNKTLSLNTDALPQGSKVKPTSTTPNFVI